MKDWELSIKEIQEYTRSIYWGQIYNSTITNSKWLYDKAISPGRWAVGYEYLYVLYRALTDSRPESILELGLGQSTKLTAQYARYMGIPHLVIEHDPQWTEYFLSGWPNLSGNTIVQLLPLEQRGSKEDIYFAYHNFGQVTQKDGGWSLISIDGPFGGKGEISRRDVLGQLPHILAKDFVIIMDDCGRLGEANTVKEMLMVLQQADISCEFGVYDGGGTKKTCVITSDKWKWLTSL